MSVSYKKLWKILIDRDMSKTKLCKEAKISTNAMAKMGKGEDVRMETLIKVCKVLDCKIDDIVDYNYTNEEKSNAAEVTTTRETLLAEHTKS